MIEPHARKDGTKAANPSPPPSGWAIPAMGKIKTERREIKKVVRDIAVWSSIAAVAFGGIGLLLGPLWAVCGGVGGALWAAIVIGGLPLLAPSVDTDNAVLFSSIAALVCGGIGLLFGTVGAACGAVGGALLTAIAIGLMSVLATQAETENNEEEGPSDEEGFRHGLWTSKYPNGNPKSEQTYRHGVKDGSFSLWLESGQKAAAGAHQNGKLHGCLLFWHENGQKYQESQYDEGEPRGPHTYWYENGQKFFEAGYQKKDVFHGDWKTWHENGQKWIEAGYVFGTPHGLWTEWDAQGHVLRQSRFVAGVQYGRGTRFFSPPLSPWEISDVKLWRKLSWLAVLVAAALVVWYTNPFMGALLLGLWVVILVHELGHFALAKLAGIPIQKFVVGFGPKLAGLQFGQTRLELRLIPLLGWVQPYQFRHPEFAYFRRACDRLRRGEPLPDYPAVDPEEEARGAPEFVSRPRHLAFVLGGITFNLLAAFLVMWLALLTATNEGAETPPLSRGPLTAGQLVVKQASVTIATFVPSLRQTLSPDSPRPMLIVHDSLGTGGEMIFSISIFLALLNLLPIPPLDGFRALCISIELVLRREVPKKVLRPVLIAGALFIGAFLVRDLASLGIGTIVSVFNIALERWAERSRGPTEIVGPPTGAFLLERNLKLFDGKSTTNIEPRAGNRFVGLQFSFEGVKTLVPAEYPIEDPGSNRYQPLGVAFGERGPEFYGSSYVERVELRRAPEGAKNLSIKMSGFSGDGPPKLVAEELRQPEIIFLYEVPKDVTQFELQHHSLRHAFKLENSGSIR